MSDKVILLLFIANLMTSEAVIKFLKSNRLIMPELPAIITSFHSIDTLKGIIAYCMKEEGLVYYLDDLPFGRSFSVHFYIIDSKCLISRCRHNTCIWESSLIAFLLGVF